MIVAAREAGREPFKIADLGLAEFGRKEIRLAKEAGFNMIRPWRHPPAPMWLDLADEMGMYEDDLDRLGMLSFDAWRAGRLVVDTGIHGISE